MIRFEKQAGRFVKHCPCTPDVVPCGYYNLNLHTGCPYSCSYCILQAYLDTTEPVFFTNFGDLEKELQEASKTYDCLRIGTGELTDSLALDNKSGYSNKILKIFEKFPDIVFEFKTKSTQVDNIIKYAETSPGTLKNIVISWSLNPHAVIEREELLTPDLSSRLKALEKAQQAGFKIGIHFDPMVIFNGWQAAYLELIETIAKVIEPGQIAWWSLGALRFPYALRDHIFKYKDSRLFEGELVKGHDGKYRYFKPLRLELFHFAVKHIRSLVSQDAPLYLCMEDQEVWQEVLPGMPADEEAVNRFLYRRAMY